MFFLFSARFIYKRSNHLFYSNYTYSQLPQLLNHLMNVYWSYHLYIVDLINLYSYHSPIHRPLIYPQSTWYYAVSCLFIIITDPIYITTYDRVPGILMLSPVFCYQIFLWFSENSLHLHSKLYTPLINPQLHWSSAVYCQLICIADPIYISPTDPIPGILLLSMVLCY